MNTIPIGWATDLAILELTGSQVTDNGDHLVVRTPANPDYHWGNCILVTDPAAVNDADRWASRFVEEFSAADWLAIGLPVMPTDTEAWSTRGIELESLDVLSTRTSPRAAPLADGYSVRALTSVDHETIVQRELAEVLESGEYEPVMFERFLRARTASTESMIERGVAQWFGAFSGDTLVSDLGIVRCGSTARYQAVGTDAAHRRKGLASHLLGVAAQWAAEQGCTEWAIVTESTNDAGRVYRRAGFGLDTASVNAYRIPPTS